MSNYVDIRRKRELQHLEKIDAGYTEKFRNKRRDRGRKKGATKVYARTHELNKNQIRINIKLMGTMSYNAELREGTRNLKLHQEVRVLMENIKSDIIPLLSSYEYLIEKQKEQKYVDYSK